MKRLSLSLAVVILALSSAVSASDFEEDKQYISCRKGAVNDRQLTACQERLLERLDPKCWIKITSEFYGLTFS